MTTMTTRYIDTLFWPRMVCFGIGVLATIYVVWQLMYEWKHGEPNEEWDLSPCWFLLAWSLWIIFGIIHTVKKSNFQDRQLGQ